MLVFFSLRRHLTAGNTLDVLKDSIADLLDSFGSVDHATRREIQIVFHLFEHWCVRDHFTTGAMALPMVVPRPVVKTINVAPAATSPGVDS